jgi:hypothetical protein
MFEQKQSVNKFSIECYNVLLNIRHRYVDTDIISSQIDLALKNQYNEVKSEENGEDTIHKFMCILELANLIGNITNTLNFECRSAELKA